MRWRVGNPAEACDARGGRPRPSVGDRPRPAVRGLERYGELAEAFGERSPEASDEGASGESESRPRPAVVSSFRSLRSLSSRFLVLA